MVRTFLAVGALVPLCIALGQVKIAPDTRPIKPSTRLQLQLEVDPPTAGTGARVFAKLRLKNVSDKAVTLQDSDPNYDFRVSAVDAPGLLDLSYSVSTYQIDESFQMTVLYNPYPSSGGIYVPLYSVDWGWYTTASAPGGWLNGIDWGA